MGEELDIDATKLIALVEQRPILWDKTLKDYKDKQLTANAWKEICYILHDNFDESSEAKQIALGRAVIKKWTNIRDAWMKWYKKCRYLQKCGSKSVRKYIYHDQLLFLNKVAQYNESESILKFDPSKTEYIETSPIIRPLNSPSDLQIDAVLDLEPVASTTNGAMNMKRKYENDGNDSSVESKLMKLIEYRVLEESNPHLSFFKSILPLINKFSEDDILEFQAGVIGLIKQIKNSN